MRKRADGQIILEMLAGAPATKFAWEVSIDTLKDAQVQQLHALLDEAICAPLPLIEERAPDEAIYSLQLEWRGQEYSFWLTSRDIPSQFERLITFVQHRGALPQTEGGSLRHPKTRGGAPVVTGDPGIYLPRLRAIILGLGFGLRTARFRDGASGQLMGDEITIQADLSPAEEFATAVHELSHAMLHGHAGRTDCTKTWEAEAELISSLVSEHIGLDAAEAAIAYFEHHDLEERHLTANKDEVLKVVELICDALDKAEGLAILGVRKDGAAPALLY